MKLYDYIPEALLMQRRHWDPSAAASICWLQGIPFVTKADICGHEEDKSIVRCVKTGYLNRDIARALSRPEEYIVRARWRLQEAGLCS